MHLLLITVSDELGAPVWDKSGLAGCTQLSSGDSQQSVRQFRGIAIRKLYEGVSKSHDHRHMHGVQNSGIMDTLYYNRLYLL